MAERYGRDGRLEQAEPAAGAVTPAAGRTRDRTAAERMRRYRARRRGAAPLLFERPDWTLFTDPATLPQKAGVPSRLLVRLALKELVDNALDVGRRVAIERDGAWWRVTDDGPGLDRARIERLFRLDRPLVSSKLLRRPTRGTLGNGLRAAVGVVIASGGEMEVHSRGAGYRLAFHPDGSTRAVPLDAGGGTAGTEVRVAFGPALAAHADDGAWAELALALNRGRVYDGPSSPHWYGAGAFHRLLHAAPAAASVADVLAEFGVASDDGRPARDLDRGEAARVLDAARATAEPVDDLGAVGRDALACAGYAKRAGARLADGVALPAVAEVWATARPCPPSKARARLTICVNRTPAPAPITGYFYERRLFVEGAGLNHWLDGVPATARYAITVNLLTPYVALTSDGKTPDLAPLVDLIAGTVAAACSKARRAASRGRGRVTIKDAAYRVMPRAYLAASAGGALPANVRQIMYAARPMILAMTGAERLDDRYFCQVLVPDYLRESPEQTADWDVVFDARGHLIEPHTGRAVPLGTLEVRQYLGDRPGFAEGEPAAPAWPTSGPRYRFGAVLFVEKEGFGPLLRAARLAERSDVALMSTKGMSVTAARLLLDRWAVEHPGLKVLVAHDFDAAGFSIVGTLAGDTRRYAYENAVEIVDIGLRLEDVRAWGLQDEPVRHKGDWARIASTLCRHGATDAEVAVLRARRVELNAFTSERLVAWLEAKLEEHGVAKVLPGGATLERAARAAYRLRLEAAARRARAGEVARQAAAVALPADLGERVEALLRARPSLPWDAAVAAVAADLPLPNMASGLES